MSKNEAKPVDAKSIAGVADQLQRAEADRKRIPPIVSDLGAGNVHAAYQVQAEMTRRRIGAGCRLVGRKIGLTSVAVQQQLGVSEPDLVMQSKGASPRPALAAATTSVWDEH